MSVNSLKKDIDSEKKKRAKKLKEQVKKFNESKSTNEFVSEQEHDSDILELYQKMSPQQKAAFNAELEASTAGEAGKSFRIVANEIRRLSDGIIDGTREIKEKINEIQHSSDSLILASESSTEKINTG